MGYPRRRSYSLDEWPTVKTRSWHGSVTTRNKHRSSTVLVVVVDQRRGHVVGPFSTTSIISVVVHPPPHYLTCVLHEPERRTAWVIDIITRDGRLLAVSVVRHPCVVSGEEGVSPTPVPPLRPCTLLDSLLLLSLDDTYSRTNVVHRRGHDAVVHSRWD